jgi:ribonuclease I
MAVTLSTREREFLARSSATIAAMDQSKVKSKTIEDDSSKQYKANKNRQGRRWTLYVFTYSWCVIQANYCRFTNMRPDANLNCAGDLKDFMILSGPV